MYKIDLGFKVAHGRRPDKAVSGEVATPPHGTSTPREPELGTAMHTAQPCESTRYVTGVVATSARPMTGPATSPRCAGMLRSGFACLYGIARASTCICVNPLQPATFKDLDA